MARCEGRQGIVEPVQDMRGDDTQAEGREMSGGLQVDD